MELKNHEDEVDRIGEIFVQSVGKQYISHMCYHIPITYCKGPNKG